MIHRACSVPLRWRDGQREMLVFNHPQAGRQLVKGRIEAGERPALVACRELGEESGQHLTSPTHLGQWRWGDHSWEMFTFDGSSLPDGWTHHCHDDGGHNFQFHWWPVASDLSDAHEPFVKAAQWLRATLAHSRQT